MKKIKFIISITIFLGFISSCTVEKRQHLSGYHINWGTYIKGKSAAAQVQKTPKIEALPINKHTIQHAFELEHQQIYPITPKNEAVIAIRSKNNCAFKKEIFKNHASDSCDILTFKNGNEISVKVLEINAKQVKYRFCNPDGNTIITEEKANIFSVKYANGIKEVFSKNEPQTSNSENRSGDDGKSQLIALILCLFLGGIGVHRFYLGYPGIGILYLLTGGLLGIGSLIDLILIITGDLKPKKGDYTEKL